MIIYHIVFFFFLISKYKLNPIKLN